MKILVTGGYGFIGSAVVRMALSDGYDVINVDCQTYAANTDSLSKIAHLTNFYDVNCDIRDYNKLYDIFEFYRPDSVIHLAAESHVDNSIDDPSAFISTNILGTYNVLEVSRHLISGNKLGDPFRLIHVSTDEVFGSLDLENDCKFTECSPYRPNSPYSASKASSDHLVRAWYETYNFPAIITNCTNNYGPYQFSEKFIPVIIQNALNGRQIPVYGSGNNVRDWLYVDDHASALLQVLKNGNVGENYCVGGDNEISNISLVNKICNIMDELNPRVMGKYSDLIYHTKDRPGHDLRYAIDSSKIRNQLGWKPSTEFEKGLRKTVEWYLMDINQ